MTDLRTAAQQALETLEMSRRFVYADNRPQCDGAIDALRAALVQQDEPVTEDMKSAVRWAPSSAYWSQQLRGLFGPDAREGIDALERRLAEAQQAEPVKPVATLIAQRDALLEALKDATKTIEHLGYPLAAIERARAAIKAVEETK